MTTVQLSTKCQIVIPKEIRTKMKLKAGERVAFYVVDAERAILVKHPKEPVAALKGLGKEMWRTLGGSAKYIKQERASWNK